MRKPKNFYTDLEVLVITYHCIKYAASMKSCCCRNFHVKQLLQSDLLKLTNVSNWDKTY